MRMNVSLVFQNVEAGWSPWSDFNAGNGHSERGGFSILAVKKIIIIKKRFPVFRCPAALTRAEGSSSASVKTLESATSPSIAGKLRKYVSYRIYIPKKGISNKIVPLYVGLHSGCGLPSWRSSIRYWVNRSGYGSLTPPPVFDIPTPALEFLPHGSLSSAFGPSRIPSGPIFRRNLFFIAPKTQRLLPVWRRTPGARLQVSTEELLPAREGAAVRSGGFGPPSARGHVEYYLTSTIPSLLQNSRSI